VAPSRRLLALDVVLLDLLVQIRARVSMASAVLETFHPFLAQLGQDEGLLRLVLEVCSVERRMAEKMMCGGAEELRGRSEMSIDSGAHDHKPRSCCAARARCRATSVLHRFQRGGRNVFACGCTARRTWRRSAAPEGDVFLPFAQRGRAHRDDVEPIEQISRTVGAISSGSSLFVAAMSARRP